MGHTAIEKILIRASGGKDAKPGDIVRAVPSFYMSHDNTGEIINKIRETEDMARQEIQRMLQSEGIERSLDDFIITPKDPSKIVIAFDHTVGSTNPKHHEYHNAAREYVKGNAAINFYDDIAGVCHQVFMEEGYAQPGSLVIGADSHMTLHGAANAAGIPINRTEMAGLWIRDYIELKVPETILVELQGKLRRGVYSKDIVLHMLSQIGSNGANYKALEFTGEGISGLSMSERMTITNMAVEMGAKTAIMPYDSTLQMYLEGIAKRTMPNPVSSDDDAIFYENIKIDLNGLEAMIAKPHDVENVVPLSEVEGTKITHAYLGSCTNGRYEDLEIAARILEGKKVHPHVHLMVYPASARVESTAKSTGVYDTIVQAGAHWMIPACGPCFGAVGNVLGEGDVCISSSNRNFKGRMGKGGSVYLASPATVAASALEGKISSEGKQ
jgi:homoaconitate hydratase family protein